MRVNIMTDREMIKSFYKMPVVPHKGEVIFIRGKDVIDNHTYTVLQTEYLIATDDTLSVNIHVEK